MTATGKPSSSNAPSGDNAVTVPAATPPPSAETGLTIESQTMSLRTSSPARATPTAYTRRQPGSWPSGPSNRVLVTLWLVAALSIGLAAYLYLR